MLQLVSKTLEHFCKLSVVERAERLTFRDLFPDRGQFTFLQVLGIVLVIIKLNGDISWSWLWITSPFWCYQAFLLFCFLLRPIVVLSRRIAKRNSE